MCCIALLSWKNFKITFVNVTMTTFHNEWLFYQSTLFWLFSLLSFNRWVNKIYKTYKVILSLLRYQIFEKFIILVSKQTFRIITKSVFKKTKKSIDSKSNIWKKTKKRISKLIESINFLDGQQFIEQNNSIIKKSRKKTFSSRRLYNMVNKSCRFSIHITPDSNR